MNKLFSQLGKKTLRRSLTAWYSLFLGLSLILFSGYLYLKLEKSLIAQLDTALQLAASQTLNNLIEENHHPALRKNAQSQIVTHRLLQTGFTVRLLSADGQIWDGFGRYQSLPPYLPTTTGYVDLKGESKEQSDRTTWRVYNHPLATTGKYKGWLQVAESLAPVYEASQHLLTLMLLGFPLILLIAGLGGLFLADRALRPIDRIIRTAEAISARNFTKRIGYQNSADEVGRLAITIDQMLDHLQAAFEHERRFTADAAHELRTPLTVIKGRIGVTLSRKRTSTEYENTLQDLEQETDRLIRLTNALLFLARLEQGQLNHPRFKRVDLTNLLSALVEQMQPLAEAKQIDLRDDILPDLFIQGNPDYLTNLFLNLLDNAFKYTPNCGYVTVKTKRDPQQITVEVCDTGVGIEAKHLPYLFERFYRVEDSRDRHTGGAGLGLAIAYEIARLHNGILTVESQLHQGTCFKLILPPAEF